MKLIKRDGRIVDFDAARIKNAIEKAMSETIEGVDSNLAMEIAMSIKSDTEKSKGVISVEGIQDLVEERLMASSRKDAAKKYILYRKYRNRSRPKKTYYKLLDDDFIAGYKHRLSPLKPMGEFVYYRTYSRWLQDERRREYWWETVRRAVEYNCNLVEGVSVDEAQKLFDNIYNVKQFLSGRTFWIGGTEIANEYGTSNYNCAFCIIDEFEKFKELFYLLMVGTGIGFRILRTDVEKLPPVRNDIEVIHEYYRPLPVMEREDNTSLIHKGKTVEIIIGDSKEGWSQALDSYFRILYSHEYRKTDTVILNYKNVRPKGERLKRFGGTASGHESLKTMFEKITGVILRLGREENKNRCRLRPIHCLDICNIIGENVVVGGVRRTAEVGIIDAGDRECIQSKTGLYYQDENKEWIENKTISHRKMSNNSIFYMSKPSHEQLHWQLEQMKRSGEPGFINVEAAKKRRPDFEGINPCGEILLKDRGLCNLTTVNVAAFVTGERQLDMDGLLEAQRLSVRAGIRMTCLELELHTWDRTQKENCVIGASLTGWQDAMDILDYNSGQEEELEVLLRKTAHDEARSYAGKLGIPCPSLVCTVKPEGTLSLLPSVSSGLHYSHSRFYIRRIRINSGDPIVKVCEELGYPVLPESGQNPQTASVKVVEFPVKSPARRTKYEITAIEQLENYKRFMKNYVDHNASITITVKSNEWSQVEQWLRDNWDDVVAVSFLALDDSFYPLMPYEAVSEEEYESRVSKMKPFIPSLLAKYEKEDQDAGAVNESCENGICPVR